MRQPKLALLLLLCLPVQAQQSDTAKARKELQEVRQDIEKTEQQRRAHQQKMQALETELRQADLQLAEAAKAVSAQQQQLSLLDKRLATLKQRQSELEQQKKQQQELLAAQVKAAYQVGGHDYTQLLLNQQDALKLERILTYYQFFNKARMEQLQALQLTVNELATLAADERQARTEQANRLDELKSQQQSVQQARSQQQEQSRQLKELLSAQKDQLAYLRSNEKSLQSTINQLKEQAKARRQAYQAKNRSGGKLQWPVQGKLVQRFGAQTGGESTASGLVIEAANGLPVRAVDQGQVIFADWLKGYGWVIVLDHGNGLMSLYGHNQSLLKSPGDVVRAGDHLALVGQSGGRTRSGLYFEIRQKGIATDPLRWLRNP